MCPLKTVPLYLSGWWVLTKYFSFFVLSGQRELLGAPTFVSRVAQVHFCWEPDVPGQQRSSKHQIFRNKETPRKPEEKEAQWPDIILLFSWWIRKQQDKNIGSTRRQVRKSWCKVSWWLQLPGPCNCRLTWDYLGGTTGLHTLCLEQASKQGRTMACPCSPPCHPWPSWWPQGWEGRGGGCQPLPVHHPLAPLTGKWVIPLSHSPLLIPWLVLPP